MFDMVGESRFRFRQERINQGQDNLRDQRATSQQFSTTSSAKRQEQARQRAQERYSNQPQPTPLATHRSGTQLTLNVLSMLKKVVNKKRRETWTRAELSQVQVVLVIVVKRARTLMPQTSARAHPSISLSSTSTNAHSCTFEFSQTSSVTTSHLYFQLWPIHVPAPAAT